MFQFTLVWLYGSGNQETDFTENARKRENYNIWNLKVICNLSYENAGKPRDMVINIFFLFSYLSHLSLVSDISLHEIFALLPPDIFIILFSTFMLCKQSSNGCCLFHSIPLLPRWTNELRLSHLKQQVHWGHCGPQNPAWWQGGWNQNYSGIGK